MKKLFVVLAMLAAMNASGQWVQVPNGMGTDKTVNSFTVSASTIFVAAQGSVFLTTNNGAYWDTRMISNYSHTSIMAKDNYMFAGKFGSGVYVSTDYGIIWNQSVWGLNNLYVNALINNGNYVFAGTMGGVFFTTNNGELWTNSGISFDIRSFTKNGNNIFAGTWGNGLYLTTNNGVSWIQKGLADKSILSLTISENNLFAGTSGSGVYRSTDNGTTWSQTSFSYEDAYSLLAIGTNIFSGGSSYPSSFTGICLTTNNGLNWTKINQGFSNVPSIYSLYVYNNYIFAGTQGQSVWRRSLSEIIGIQSISTEIPAKYSLSQNYPNPFNPTTNIKFNVAKLSVVKIVVYDVIGREVQTLVNESLKPGTYETSFDGSSFNSGVYFYKITSGDYTETKKMLMLK